MYLLHVYFAVARQRSRILGVVVVWLWMLCSLNACGTGREQSLLAPTVVSPIAASETYASPMPATTPSRTAIIATTSTSTVTIAPTSTPTITPTYIPTRKPTRTPAPLTASPAPPSEVIITLPPAASVISALVGQIIRVVPPDSASEWTISYSDQILTNLTASDQLRNPNPVGWRLQAIHPGQTDIMVTSRPAPCPTQQPCSPAVMQFTFTINIRAR